MSSLKTPADIVKFPPVWIPPEFQWQNYVEIFGISRIPVTTWAWNSLIIVVLGTAGTVITASLVAYSLARFDYRGRNLLFMVTLATLMIPADK